MVAEASRSVVAISLVRKRVEGQSLYFEIRPGPLGMPIVPQRMPAPEDPDFIPIEYATGVVVDRLGLILTAYHVLEADSEYFVTTCEHKRYPAWIKAADPRSDLALLAIDANNLVPIPLGEGGPPPRPVRHRAGQPLCDRSRRPGQRKLGDCRQSESQGRPPAG